MAAAPQQRRPDDYENLDFSIEEEHWNEYELQDGSRIKARLVLIKVLRDPNAPNAYGFDLSPVLLAVYAPPANRGPQNQEPRPDEYRTLLSYEVRAERNDEQWNRYRVLINGDEIRIKLSVTEIRRVTDRYNNNGEPFYLVTSGPTVALNRPQNRMGP